MIVIAREGRMRMTAAPTPQPPTMGSSSAPPQPIFQFGTAAGRATHAGRPGCHPTQKRVFQRQVREAQEKVTRHAESVSVNKSPDAAESSANFDSVDSCKQKPQSGRLQVAPAMKQSQPQVVRDSKDMTMSAVINRGGGRPSKGLRKYIGFRTQAKTAEDVQMIAAAKGMTVTDYVSSAVDRSLREDLALLDHFAHQEELPIRIAS
ncbi:hypothetical protein ACFRJ8_19475 [Arthrobacter sp. NPDC056886]|uniref:hypothetical protein n=2 Tax=Arthrobacter TaxID=1663 RepID=UPI00366B358E